jgi:hypothetical protein
LVLADIPSFRELWNGAAVFADPRRGDALLNSLQKLCRDGGLRYAMQHAACARARCYSLGAMMRAYRVLYDAMYSGCANEPVLCSAATLELQA